jgi:hypothetical protein
VKITTRKTLKPGWVRVRGGRILRVAKAHAVKTNTRSSLQPGLHPSEGQDWVYANEGDLAIEIVRRGGTSDVVGYSYLSGPAIQLHRYMPCDVDWFGEEVKATYLDVPHPHGAFGQEFIEQVVGLFMGFKYNEEYGVGAFDYKCDAGEDTQDVANGLITMYGYEHPKWTAPRTHLFGLIRPYRGKKNVVVLHCQPPHDASDFCAAGFQVELVVGALRANR